MNGPSQSGTLFQHNYLRASILKPTLWAVIFIFVANVFPQCSFEKEVTPNPQVKLFAIDPQKYIVPVLLTDAATKGMPVDTSADIKDFGFFCSYTNTAHWAAISSNCNRMYNERMIPDKVTNPNVVLWDYAGTPVMWNAATAASMFSFFAYAPYETKNYDATTNPNGNGIVITSSQSSAGIPTLSYTVPVKVENQPDLMFADTLLNRLPTGHPVPLQMRHALTAIGFQVAGSLAEKITKLSVTGVYVSGNAIMNGKDIAWTLTGSKVTTDYTASINFDPSQSYYTVTSSPTNPMKGDGWLMMLPQVLDNGAKVKISLSDGTTREVNLMIPSVIEEWKAGKRILYNIKVTPYGTTTVIPDLVALPYNAQAPATEHLTVICQDFEGNPSATESWTLTVPSTAPWLKLTLNSDGSGASTSVSSTTGSKTVYLVVDAFVSNSIASRSADLTLDGSAHVATTITQYSFPGSSYAGWVYVRKEATGNGSSWSDAAPTINAAMTAAGNLLAASYPFNGILVAGGTSRIYNEALLNLSYKMYGGWEGISGTELPNDPTAPYTSLYRNLTSYKAIVNPGDGRVALDGSNVVFDGFVVQGATPASSHTVQLQNGASMNAVEIKNNKSNTSVLNINNSTATNILVANNGYSIQLSNGAKLINATIDNPTGIPSITNSSLLNSVVWHSDPITLSGSNTVQYCAFLEGEPAIALSSTNIAINLVNNAWFTSSNVVPGPHFNLNAATGKPYYVAMNNNAPMLGRGNQPVFDTSTPLMTVKKDINGNARHYLGTDMGCYEDGEMEGFLLRWATDRVYVSPNNGYVSDIPLILPGNGTLNVGVQWQVTINGSLNYCQMVGAPMVTGSGTGVVVGTVQFITVGDYRLNAERKCGEITVHTNLGGYLPDVNLEVWQTSGLQEPWLAGYVGSFHRNNEVGSRYISGQSSGQYTVRIVSGLDWIKIDQHPKNYGADILSEPNPYGLGGYKKEVEEVFGGVITGTGNITFRVGMKSVNPNPGQPRYGLIQITRSGGVSFFYVRQGEAADYLYRPADPPSGFAGDPRVIGGVDLGRANAVKYSPFSLSDPTRNANANGYNVGPGGGVFADYPSQIGYFFQWNQTTAYRYTVATSCEPVPLVSAWDPTKDVCPAGYRQAPMAEWIQSLYWQSPVPAPNTKLDPAGVDAQLNFLDGHYADGYYDVVVADPVPFNLSWTSTSNSYAAATTMSMVPQPVTGPYIATRGVLMVNHYNYAAIFFPTISSLQINGSLIQVGLTYLAMSDLYSVFTPNTAHWSGMAGTTTPGIANPGHIGVNCSYSNNNATPVRCVRIP